MHTQWVLFMNQILSNVWQRDGGREREMERERREMEREEREGGGREERGRERGEEREMESEERVGGGREERRKREGREERERVSTQCPVPRGDDEGKTQCIHLVTISYSLIHCSCIYIYVLSCFYVRISSVARTGYYLCMAAIGCVPCMLMHTYAWKEGHQNKSLF